MDDYSHLRLHSTRTAHVHARTGTAPRPPAARRSWLGRALRTLRRARPHTDHAPVAPHTDHADAGTAPLPEYAGPPLWRPGGTGGGPEGSGGSSSGSSGSSGTTVTDERPEPAHLR